MLNAIYIASIVGIIQSLFFVILLRVKRKKNSADQILQYWFLVYIIHLALIISIDQHVYLVNLSLAKTIGLMHGPFLFWYTKAAFKGRFLTKDLIHSIPFIVFNILIFTHSLTPSTRLEAILFIIKVISLTAYPIYVYLWLKNRFDQLKQTRADNFLLDSKWINALIFLLLIYAVLGIFHVIADVLLNIKFSILLDIILYVSMITIMGFYGLKYRVVYDSEVNENILQSQKERYKTSSLKDKEITDLKNKITNYFDINTEFLDTNFSLSILSEKLDIPKHHLSEVINLQMNSTFYDMVNKRRIEYAMSRIKNSSDVHITLEGLGYESGFKTKSAFYHHFKRFTGKTPGKFKSEMSTD